MKILTALLTAIVITTSSIAQVYVNSGISFSSDENLETGITLGLRSNLINSDLGEATTLSLALETQYSTEKAWGDTDKLKVLDFGPGLYLLTNHFEVGIVSGFSYNSLPGLYYESGESTSSLAYDESLGFYGGLSALTKYPVSDVISIFLMSRLTYKTFNADYAFLYTESNGDYYTEIGTEQFSYFNVLISAGLKFDL